MAPLTHAGGVVIKVDSEGMRYLLVPARDNPSHIVFPKGHIEQGETPRDAALREVREEAGVKAEVSAVLGTVEITVGGRRFGIMFYLMRFLGDVESGQKRPTYWLSYNEALETITFEESRKLLRTAHAIAQNKFSDM